MGHRGYQKANGITYVYEGVSEWDKEKKRSVQKRKYIGKLDEDTGELIPNKSYIVSETIVVKTYNYGNFYLLDNIITQQLKVYPKNQGKAKLTKVKKQQ